MLEIDAAKLRIYLHDIYRIDTAHWEDILTLLDSMLHTWQNNMSEAYFSEEDVIKLRETVEEKEELMSGDYLKKDVE